ncbi:GntR family transcriptional regulator [Roseomonas hellenica]|uniref:GntR family transcriptional regulator n=1 Tax=Plastoroseomonas hellenica TaxID=2687306 RepID=A0ABS5F4S7_9PROT|nr:GntR family transcriptional regulator [Plastoroseomonas hellenica]MBR0667572.1 GntR family transcriptional regulator [Plastoroseomonas hellenica]
MMHDDSGRPGEELLHQGRSAAGHAYDQLVEMLLSRRLEPDDVVQERRLAAELGVSRTPLREAMHRLEGEGILARRSDGALVVPRLDAEETLEVLSVRRLLEVEAAGAAAGKVPSAVIEALRRRVQALAATGDPASPERLLLDLDLHRAIGEACGNRCLARMIADMRRRTQLFATRRTPERLEPICAEHLKILRALEADDAEAARKAMAEHIDATRAGIMRRLGAV